MRKTLASIILAAAALALPAAAQQLTDAQKAALHAALSSEKEAILAVGRAEESARLALDDAVMAVPYDAARVEAAFAPVAAADADLAALRARLYAKSAAILTPEQLAQANALLAFAGERIGARVERALERRLNVPAALLTEEKSARAALRAAIRRPVPDEASARAASARVSAADLEIAQLRAERHASLTGAEYEKMAKVHAALRAFLTERAESLLRLAGALL